MDGRVRGDLARFEHEGVARQQAGSHLPTRLKEWVVPRRDEPADADRLTDHPALDARSTLEGHVVGRWLGQAGVVAKDARHVVDVVFALDQSLAGVEGLLAGQGVLVPQQQIGDAPEESSTVSPRGGRPGAVVEGGPGGSDGGSGVRFGGLVHDPHDGAVGRAGDDTSTALGRGHPRSVEEQVRHGRLRVSLHIAQLRSVSRNTMAPRRSAVKQLAPLRLASIRAAWRSRPPLCGRAGRARPGAARSFGRWDRTR